MSVVNAAGDEGDEADGDVEDTDVDEDNGGPERAEAAALEEQPGGNKPNNRGEEDEPLKDIMICRSGDTSSDDGEVEGVDNISSDEDDDAVEDGKDGV